MSETDGAVERQHPLPDVLRRDNRSGSSGTQKEHYDLRQVKARKKLTEILYIFFGIHTANVVQLADRI